MIIYWNISQRFNCKNEQVQECFPTARQNALQLKKKHPMDALLNKNTNVAHY